MILKSLSLQNFRNYSKTDFSFSPQTTIIIGPNGRGKSNLLEAIFLLATGKSFHAENEKQMIQFGKQFCRIKTHGDLEGIDDEVLLEIVFVDQGTAFLKKKYLVNGVSKRRIDFAGHLIAVLFTPSHVDIVTGSPQIRRRFLDEVLEQTDREYRLAVSSYTKALRQRNALLQKVQETGVRDEQMFAYWDELLLSHGKFITSRREKLLAFINHRQKDFFSFSIIYDKSEISKERLHQYKQAEVGAGVTLVGPHRDDFFLTMLHSQEKDPVVVKQFASRGQQRLVTLELKLAQIAYLQEQTGKKPLLLLDDIFSELDSKHIQLVLSRVTGHQIIMTTTHKEFISGVGEREVEMIELENNEAV